MDILRIILTGSMEKLYRNAQIHQGNDGTLTVVREVEIMALDNIVEPDADVLGECIHATTLASETIAYFVSGSYTAWETIEASA